MAINQSTTLIGMMGCGKSTFGERLAETYGQPFIDTDQLIEDATHTTCAELVADPTVNFSEVQERVILGFTPEEPTVIATGGSVGINPHLTDHLALFGPIIFINPDPADLRKRLGPERIASLNISRDYYIDGRVPTFEELCIARGVRYGVAAHRTLRVPLGEDKDTTFGRLLAVRPALLG